MRHIDVSGVAISSERSIACTRWFRWWNGAPNILFQYMIGHRDVRDDVRDVSLCLQYSVQYYTRDA